jgi:hypothetical protein
MIILHLHRQIIYCATYQRFIIFPYFSTFYYQLSVNLII